MTKEPTQDRSGYDTYAYLINSNEPFIERYDLSSDKTYRIYPDYAICELTKNVYPIAFEVDRTSGKLISYPTGYRYGYKTVVVDDDSKKEYIETSGNKFIKELLAINNNQSSLDILSKKKGRKSSIDNITQSISLNHKYKAIILDNDLKISPTINVALKEFLEKRGLL